MDKAQIFDSLELSSSFRPVLDLPNEQLLLLQTDVGLYLGKERLADYDNGRAYLTTHRILWVHNDVNLLQDKNQQRAVSVLLERVSAVESAAGFLRSSPKISLTVQVKAPPDTTDRLTKTSTSSHATTTTTTPSSMIPQDPWTCDICFQTNLGSVVKCELCGVKRTTTATSATTSSSTSSQPRSPSSSSPRRGTSTSSTPSYPSLDHHYRRSSSSTKDTYSTGSSRSPPTRTSSRLKDDQRPNRQPEQRSCPVCTFLNHPDLRNCEMCDSPLYPEEGKSSRTSQTSLESDVMQYQPVQWEGQRDASVRGSAESVNEGRDDDRNGGGGGGSVWSGDESVVVKLSFRK
ncbi:hypothetical protein HK102_008099, partial [Quaeritorhiza haematococci]